MPNKMTQAKATEIAGKRKLRAFMSGNTVYICAVVATLRQAKGKPVDVVVEQVTPEGYDPNQGLQAGVEMMHYINGKDY